MCKIDETEAFSKQLGADEEYYMPLYELFDIALKHKPRMTTNLIKKTNTLPPSLIEKTFHAMCEEKLPK